MFRGFYTAASGMLSQMRQQQMMTNNLSNINTPGYKTDRASSRAFGQMVLDRVGGEAPKVPKTVGELATGTYMQETMPKFRQGDLMETGNSADVALLQGEVPDEEGSLFFAVRNADGEIRYTRNGNFTVDGGGRLTDNEGDLVLGRDGEPVAVANERFIVADDGTVTSEGNEAGQIQVAYAEDPMDLIKEGNSLFHLEGGGALPTAADNADIHFQIKQHFLERSNVDSEQAMTDLMSSFRNLQSNQKVLQAYDSTMDKAVNQVGRLG